MTSTPQRTLASRPRQWLALGLVMLGWTVLGFAVLPALARVPAIKTRIDFHAAKQINGNATFYTEQDFLLKQEEGSRAP